MMNELNCNSHLTSACSRRTFFSKMSIGIGSLALSGLLNETKADAKRAMTQAGAEEILKQVKYLNIAPKAKRVIFLFQSGGPSQLESFDHKPLLQQRNGEPLPDSVRQGQRLTGMSSNQAILPMAGAQYKFSRHGQNGMYVSELFPHTAKIVDDLSFIRSMHTDAINHDPAITFFQTGSQIAGRPSIGSWVSYGLGSMNKNLPEFIVLITKKEPKGTQQPLYNHLWSNGFIPSIHQGVKFIAGKNPVYYLNNPDGVSGKARRKMLDTWVALQESQMAKVLDPEINSRISQYEMAYRMQTSVPDVVDVSDEPDAMFDLYGEDARTPGSFAANCMLARKLAEQDVRFIQLYHQGWDHHGDLPKQMTRQAKQTDQASAALVTDLKQRGMLEDTLVIWGGEFGRTNYSQGTLTKTSYGRDHHPRCFTMWMAGGGVKPGTVYGETDPFGYNIVKDPVHVHDFQATLMHLMGMNHEKLTYKFQGRRFRLTDVHGHVVKDILA